MKKKMVVIIVVLIVNIASFAQDIKFTYDNAGNRTSRHVIPAGSTTKTTEEPVIETSFIMNVKSSVENEVKPEIYEDVLAEKQIRIYPNPTRGKVRIEMGNYNWNTRGNIKVFDMGGRLIRSVTSLIQSMEIDISNEPPGTYIIVIVIGDEKSEWEIIKQ